MALQSDDLSALGLGIIGDQPPTGSLQPSALPDGNHIRYATSLAKGLPWYGFYLFRRRHKSAREQCLGRQLAKLPPGPTDTKDRAFSGVSVHSSAPIAFVDEFPARGEAEISLPPAAPLDARFDDPVHRVTARIGFCKSGGPAIEPGKPQPTVASANAGSEEQTVTESRGRAPDARRRDEKRPRRGSPPSEPPPAQMRAVRMVAKDADVIVAETLISGRPGDIVVGEVAADRITSVEFQPVAAPRTGPGRGGEPAPSRRQQENPSRGREEEPASTPAAAVSAVAPPPKEGEKEAGYAALVDLCWSKVADALKGRWEPLGGFPYPMALPVAEPGYPCAGKPASPAAAQAIALWRVRYGAASAWAAKFPELHDVLGKLVAGGPGGGPMNLRTGTFVDAGADPDATPKLPGENLLQLVTLASIDPAMAQILGLYWVDSQPAPGQAYDYLVIADHDNAFGGQYKAALAAANGEIPAGADTWITFNHAPQNRAPLPPPAAPIAYVLPDTAVSGAVGAPRGAVGLTWSAQSLGPGYLTSDAALRFIAWRHDYGAPAPAAQGGAFLPLNQHAPYLVGSGASAAATAKLPSHWPPAAIAVRAVDRKLAEGWYGYCLSGIDIWGRHSPLGPPAPWRQWAPAPKPEPWYYQNPAADKQLHGFAVHILDKTPPPPPAAVEATALDPKDEDSYVRDAAYEAWRLAAGDPWWTGLSDAQRAAVLPLRVRWRWYPAQQDQHPNTSEFRIYFNPGSTPPDPDRFDPVSWQERVFVCDYDDHVALVPAAAGDPPYRQYEVLLPLAAPSAGDPPFAGVALQPSLTQPIVYANVSVSAADDRTHGADHAKWTGTPWGGRQGNEGLLAAPAKIYRVWRALPPAPAALINDERVWATKADYHSMSFYSFRWAASPQLKAHVYAVMDATLFMVERADPAAVLDGADLTALGTVWGSVPTNVTGELNALRALKATATDAEWEAACLGLGDGALRGLAALPLHEESYVRQTVEPVDPPDAAGADDPAGYVPTPAWRAWRATFDGRARNRYFLRAAYIDPAHNEGPLGPPTPPIYLPPAVPPRTPVITRVTGGDRQAVIAWTTAGAEAGGRYVLYRTDDDYRLRDVRLMAEAAAILAVNLDPNAAQAEWTDAGLEGGRTYYYCLSFIDADGNASAPSKASPVNVVDESVPDPPTWVEQTWLLEHEGDNVLTDWPEDGVVPADHKPVLRLSWESDVAQPAFVLTRREHGGRVWSAPPDAGQIVASATGTGEFSWIDRDADPARHWEYRLRVRAPTGTWSTDYDELGVGRPVLAE